MNKQILIKSCLALAISTLVACSGDDGKNGKDGLDGKDGDPGQVGTPGQDGKDGQNGQNGQNGKDGKDAPINQLRPSQLLTNVNNAWYIAGQNTVKMAKEHSMKINGEKGAAKNIILFVGDGMGISTVTAARILEGQLKGMQGEENVLSFGEFPFSGLIKTYNVDAQTPDSAGTMTAMISGVKTDVGVIGVDENIERGDCSTLTGNELVTALELAEMAGLSTGVLSTARITHATPAATYSKSPDRNWEDISDIEGDARSDVADAKYDGDKDKVTDADLTAELTKPKYAGCEDIASQLVNFEKNLEARYAGIDVDGIDVVMGGGRRHFLPKDASANSPDASSSVEGDRTDGRNLITEWTTTYPNGKYVFDQTGFDAINTDSDKPVFALFNESHMRYEKDRANDVAGEPSLSEMTEKAIDILDNNKKGFFLTVESGRIDHAHHAGNAYNALNDTIEFAKAVKAAVDNTDPKETLIIVTADHSHVFTIAGYPKRGNPILGKVVGVGQTEPAKAADDKPYTTLGYTNGRGYYDLGIETDADKIYSKSYPPRSGRIEDLTAVNTQAPGFHQEALVPTSAETHAGEDVGIYATGPSSHLVTGTNEQSIIFHVMEHAGNLIEKAQTVLDSASP